MSHTRTVESAAQLATSHVLGTKVRAWMGPVWPRSTCIWHWRRRDRSHTLTVWSSDADATRTPASAADLDLRLRWWDVRPRRRTRENDRTLWPPRVLPTMASVWKAMHRTASV